MPQHLPFFVTIYDVTYQHLYDPYNRLPKYFYLRLLKRNARGIIPVTPYGQERSRTVVYTRAMSFHCSKSMSGRKVPSLLYRVHGVNPTSLRGREKEHEFS